MKKPRCWPLNRSKQKPNIVRELADRIGYQSIVHGNSWRIWGSALKIDIHSHGMMIVHAGQRIYKIFYQEGNVIDWSEQIDEDHGAARASVTYRASTRQQQEKVMTIRPSPFLYFIPRPCFSNLKIHFHWCARAESNCRFQLRRLTSYPLDYERIQIY